MAGRVSRASRQAPGRDAATGTSPGAGFQPLRVAEVRRRARPSSRLLLVPTDDSAPKPAARHPASTSRCGCARATGARRWSAATRCRTSPTSVGTGSASSATGAASRYLHDRVAVGDVLDAAAPRGTFVLREGTRPVVLLSAGVGATPVLAMLHALVGEHTKRGVWWLHGARNHDEQAFGAEVDELLAELPGSHRVSPIASPQRGRQARLRHQGPARPHDYRRRGRPEGRRLLPVRTRRFHGAMGAALVAGDHSRPDSHRGVRRARRPPLRNRGAARPDTTRSRGATGTGRA